MAVTYWFVSQQRTFADFITRQNASVHTHSKLSWSCCRNIAFFLLTSWNHSCVSCASRCLSARCSGKERTSFALQPDCARGELEKDSMGSENRQKLDRFRTRLGWYKPLRTPNFAYRRTIRGETSRRSILDGWRNWEPLKTLYQPGSNEHQHHVRHLAKSVIFNLGVATPRGVVNRFWRGRELIFYVHSCITFALFDFPYRTFPQHVTLYGRTRLFHVPLPVDNTKYDHNMQKTELPALTGISRLQCQGRPRSYSSKPSTLDTRVYQLPLTTTVGVWRVRATARGRQPLSWAKQARSCPFGLRRRSETLQT